MLRAVVTRRVSFFKRFICLRGARLNKIMVIGGILLAAGVGGYAVISQRDAQHEVNVPTNLAASAVSAPQQGSDFTSPSPIKDIASQLGEIVEDLSNEHERDPIEEGDTTTSEIAIDRHPVQVPEDVPEQVRLALEMGYIESEQSELFIKEREQLNMMEEARQELESADIVE